MRRHRKEIRKAVAGLLGRIDPVKVNASGLLHASTVRKYRLMRDYPSLSVLVVRAHALSKKIKMYLQLPSERRRQEAR